MRYTDDPHMDFLRREEELQNQLDELPICDECGEPIQTEDLYDIDGVLFCENCMEGHRRSVEEYTE